MQSRLSLWEFLQSVRKQGRIHGNPVADGWAGAVLQNPLGIQKCDGPTDRPTYLPTDLPTDTARCRVACPRLKIHWVAWWCFICLYDKLISKFKRPNMLKKQALAKSTYEPSRRRDKDESCSNLHPLIWFTFLRLSILCILCILCILPAYIYLYEVMSTGWSVGLSVGWSS